MAYPPRLFNCARCACQVLICSHCDHGQIYCAGGCAEQARRDSLRQAGQRYQASRQGQLKHAARQARYRERQQKVTHQGSIPRTGYDSLVQQLKWRSKEMASGTIRVTSSNEGERRCHFCYQSCSPFVRWVFLSRYCSSIV